MGRLADLVDLIDVGEVAALLHLADKNSVTTYMRRYGDCPQPALEYAGGRVRKNLDNRHDGHRSRGAGE